MFYPNQVHSVFGEPESLKTFLLLLATKQELDAGHHVLYYDMESNDRDIVARLLDLGVAPKAILERFHYYRPDAPITDDDHRKIANGVAACKPTLVALDGITEAYAMHELSTGSAEDAAVWFQNVSRRFLIERPTKRYAGPAVVELDHVVKSRDDRNGWAIGSQHKKAGLKGAAYEVRAVTPFGRTRHGTSRLMLAKDSPGGVRWVPYGKHRERWAGELHCQSNGDGSIDAWLETPVIDDAGVGVAEDVPLVETVEFRHLMEKVWKYVSNNPSCSTRSVEAGVTGKAERKRVALDVLCDGGYIRNEGSGNAKKWAVVRHFSAVKLSANGGGDDGASSDEK